jgi:hypothetical protein
MNEQIQQLADKIWAEEYWDNPYTDKLLPAQLNKFAELIVRECAEVVKWTPSMFPNNTIIKNIKEHFGVEE